MIPNTKRIKQYTRFFLLEKDNQDLENEIDLLRDNSKMKMMNLLMTQMMKL